MYSRPTAPKSVSGVLDDVFKLYGAALPVSWRLALVGALLSAIPGFYLESSIAGGDAEQMLEALKSPVLWLTYLVLIAVSMIFFVGLIARVNQVAEGADGSFAQAVNRGFSLLPRSLGASLLYFLAVVGGMILLVVPGLIWSVSLLLYLPLLVTEDIGARAALSRSRQLVKGSWWRTAAVFTIALVIAGVLAGAVGLVSGLIAGVTSADRAVFAVVNNLVTAVVNLFITPLYVALLLSVYYDLKLRKEGGDLADRVAALRKA